MRSGPFGEDEKWVKKLGLNEGSKEDKRKDRKTPVSKG